MDKEEGEMSDDESMAFDEESTNGPDEKDYTLMYRADKEGLIVKALGKADAEKLEERARRFGVNLSGNRVVTEKQIEDLYKNLGIDDGFERHVRFDTIHARGVNAMNTKEIFEYFEDYKPISLEWINNYSCNVVCQDHISAALAILVHSREIIEDSVKKIAESIAPHCWREGLPHHKTDLILLRFATKSDKKDGNIDAQLKATTIRKQMQLNSNIMQVHEKSKNPWGDLCQTWGVYDHQEIYGPRLPDKDFVPRRPQFLTTRRKRLEDAEIHMNRELPKVQNKALAMRLGKRPVVIKSSDSEESEPDSDEWTKRNKVPRMRMHADDEEIKKEKKSSVSESSEEEDEFSEDDINNIPKISIEIRNEPEVPTVMSRLGATSLNSKFSKLCQQRGGVHSRLGSHVSTNNVESQDEESDLDSDISETETHNVMSRVERVPKKSTLASSVFARLDNHRRDRSESPRDRGDLRHTIQSGKPREEKTSKSSSDLRSRLGSKREKFNNSPIRIEVDNEYYDKSD